jgi:adenine-specific DNA-methyltransferase
MPTLNWIGKNDIINHHHEVEYNILECKENIGEENTGNLLIKGDNLLALKSILPYYAGQVKMIYIDPPYNTGSTSWVYNDATDSPTIRKWLDKVVDKEDLSRSDKWLCMMYPRLKLLKKFLKEDGVIFISIDDAEVFLLKTIMDEIFGKENFTTSLAWQSRTSKQNDTDISCNHEYILVYAKNRRKTDRRLKESNIKSWFNSKTFAFLPDDLDRNKFSNPDNDERGLWKSDPFDAPNIRENLTYEIKNPNTGDVYLPPAGRCWRTEEENYKQLFKDKRILFGKDGKARPQLKVFYEEKKMYGEVSSTWLPGNDFGTTTSGSKELKNIFGAKVFDYPKPSNMVKHLIKISTKEDDIILDSFAGSGTTGHSVMLQNKEDNFNRKFILIQMDEVLNPSIKEHKAACKILKDLKRSYSVVEITKERLNRVIHGYSFSGTEKTELFKKKITITQLLNIKTIEKIGNEVKDIIESETDNFDKVTKTFKENTILVTGENKITSFKDGLGGGFQYCELSEPLFDEYGLLNENITHEMLAKHIYFTEFGQALKVENDLSNLLGTVNETTLFLYSDKDFMKRDLTTILNKFSSKAIVYADRTTVSKDELEKNNITFKQLPFSIKDK